MHVADDTNCKRERPYLEDLVSDFSCKLHLLLRFLNKQQEYGALFLDRTVVIAISKIKMEVVFQIILLVLLNLSCAVYSLLDIQLCIINAKGFRITQKLN